MGNVNGREDGDDDSQSDGEGGAHDSTISQDAAHVSSGSYRAPPDVQLIAQSPPPSPRPANTPLMFRPQMPVVPLQRPDEMYIPTPSWMQSPSGNEDASNEQGIPTMITWSYDATDVAVEGSWDDWRTRKPLQKSGKDFTIMKVLPSGVYQYRFIVDGQFKYAPELPWTQDEAGYYYNILDLEDYVPEDTKSISGFEPPKSPDSSYNNTQLSVEDFAKEPPIIPPHLQSTLLNAPSLHLEIPPPLSRPQHVVLNHLYMQKGASSPSVVALGSSHRFKSKYVTVVLYKSINR